ncbi:P-loop ATPase, Sll1717 family [Pelagerythrobacter rhizovicinus]|uniref:ATP-binding protein n=1 Tax=Pelagerythrobacter rhizovicinus TaxID=2268576 RepID=A0A4Q2KHE5_9SPHN|nr:ATP-binding protein [Pelagerythrobacter rhizovicinus]RXZ64544.1 hypothetical protein ETX26_11690 [Pelagerythrobacter rhizovicinus]
MAKLCFNESEIRALFGSEDAENESAERFREYFVKNRAYENLRADLPLRILVGHKGVGKSALLRYSHEEDISKGILSIFLKPDDLSELLNVGPDVEINSLIDAWKTGIKRAVADKAIENATEGAVDKVDQSIVTIGARKLSAVVRDALKAYQPRIADAAQTVVYENFLYKNRVNIYIDDIDRGWSARPQDIVNISALINALKDISAKDANVQCRIGIRTDVYFLVRTSDESTDKIEQDIIRLKWTNDEILRLMAFRISTFLKLPYSRTAIAAMSQNAINRDVLSHVMEPKFHGRGKWENERTHRVMMSLCRARPRDLVKLLHGAARKAAEKGLSVISTQNFLDSFEPYSEERLQDLFNEFKSEVSNISNFIMQFKPTKVQRTAKENYHYSNDQMIVRIKQARAAAPIRFASGRIVTDRAVLTFLYKIDFIVARFDECGVAKWRFYDQGRFLAHEATEFGNSWEVHPAYRWALQPHDVQGVIDTVAVAEA